MQTKNDSTSTLDRTVHTYYNKKYKEASVRNHPKKCQTKNISATMNGLSVQPSLHASTIVLENDTRRHLRIITKTNTKKKAKNSNEKRLHSHKTDKN